MQPKWWLSQTPHEQCCACCSQYVDLHQCIDLHQHCSLAALQPCSLAAQSAVLQPQPKSPAGLQPRQPISPATSQQPCSPQISCICKYWQSLPSSPSPTAVRFQQPASFCAVLAVAALEERSVLANTKVRNCNQDISESLQDLQLCSVIDLIVQHRQLCQY
jgi:hypothetical protein